MATPARRPRAIGQITAIGNNQLTVESPRGTHTVLVNDETKFFNSDREEINFSDLAVGRWVAGGGERNEESQTITARLIVLLPEDFSPEDRPGERIGGTITQINNGQNEFSLTTRDGESLTISVDDNTRYQGDFTALTDLKKDMQVGVIVVEENGSLLAKAVLTGRPDNKGPRPHRGRAIGQITAIGSGEFTVEKPTWYSDRYRN